MKRSLVMQKRDKPDYRSSAFHELSLLGDLRMLEDSTECPACGEAKDIGRLLCGRHMCKHRDHDQRDPECGLAARWMYAHMMLSKSKPRAYELFEDLSYRLGFNHRAAIERLRGLRAAETVRAERSMRPRLVKKGA